MIKYFKAVSTAVTLLCAIFTMIIFAMSSCKKAELSSFGDNSKIEPTVPISAIKVDSVFNLTEVASAEKENARTQERYLHTDFVETGFYLEPGGSVTLQVESVAGSRLPTLIIGTLSRYHSFGAAEDGGLTYVNLKQGENIITDTKGKGGLLYVKFSNSFGISVQKAQVKFVSGMLPVPYFKYGETTNDEWCSMLSYFSNVPDVVLTTRRAIIVVSLKNAYFYQREDMRALLEKIDAVYDAYDEFAGFDGKTDIDKPNMHKILMTEMDMGTVSNPYMFTTNKRTVFLSSAISKLMSKSGFQTGDGYGVWHEMGHMYQMSAWTWSTTVEATVQLYATKAARILGGIDCELKSRNIWPIIQKYLQDTSPDKDFNLNYQGFDARGMSYWVRFGMYYQLWLYYGDQFYAALHKYYRHNPQAGFTDEVKMSNFMYVASLMAKNDLTDFFKKWGFRLNQKEYNRLAALGLPKPAKDITAITDK